MLVSGTFTGAVIRSCSPAAQPVPGSRHHLRPRRFSTARETPLFPLRPHHRGGAPAAPWASAASGVYRVSLASYACRSSCLQQPLGWSLLRIGVGPVGQRDPLIMHRGVTPMRVHAHVELGDGVNLPQRHPLRLTRFDMGLVLVDQVLVVIGEPAHHQHRSEEHTSELQSLAYLVCRLLLEKK